VGKTGTIGHEKRKKKIVERMEKTEAMGKKEWL
jgi:hypothetical protein